MLISISVEESGPEDHSVVTSLFRWLKQDLGPGAQLSLHARQVPDAQGGAFDVINALIGDGVGLAGLALAYSTWRQAHRSPQKIRFEHDGLTVVVEDASPGSLRRIEEILAGQPDRTDQPDQSTGQGADQPTDDPDGPRPSASDPARTQ